MFYTYFILVLKLNIFVFKASLNSVTVVLIISDDVNSQESSV